jgi:hypothetical protein
VDTRQYYLLTFLPPLPALGEQPAVTLPEALGRLRQQGGPDFELLADTLGAEDILRDVLDEWVRNTSGSHSAPAALPPFLTALFDEERIADFAEDAWVDAVWQAWFGEVAHAGRIIGSRLLPQWVAWETALRCQLARRRAGGGAEDESHVPLDEPGDPPGLDAVVAAWHAAREQGAAEGRLPAAVEAELLLERARLDFLDAEDPRYSFSMDELVAYLLKLRLLDRRARLEPEAGRSLLRQAVAL